MSGYGLLGVAVGLCMAGAFVWWSVRCVRAAIKDQDLAPVVGVGMLWVFVILTLIAANGR